MTDTNKNSLNKEIIFSKKVWLVDKYNFFEYVAVMLEWGVGIAESLDSVSTKIASPYFKQKIKELQTYISSGDSFSKSMKKIPQIFKDSEISVVESGENVGQLAKSLMKLSEDLKKVYELQNKIKTALTYPIIIFLFLILALIIVLTYVVPAIIPLFADSEVDLPVATKALLATSNFVVNQFWLILLLIVTLVVGLIAYKNTKTWAEQLELFIFDLPLVWTIYRNYVLANISSSLSTLVGSGVSIIKTLTLTGKASNSIIYENIFEDLVNKVSKWEWITKSMEDLDKEHKFFPLDFLQMLSVWEKTANLESISKKISIQYEKEVDYSLARLTKWIEPLAILLAWIFVSWFAFAIFGAIMKVTDTIG